MNTKLEGRDEKGRFAKNNKFSVGVGGRYKGGNTDWGVWYDPYVKTLLEKVKSAVQRDDDWVLLLDGREGSGKSVLAMQLARYLDPSFNLSKVCLSGEEFLKAIHNAKKYDCIIFDEAFRGLNWRSAYSNISKILHQVMMEMRQKNLYIIIVIPSALEVSNYVAFHRSNAFIHVYRYKGTRGYYAGWGTKKKDKLLRKAKQAHTLGVGVPIDFGGRFHNQYVVDEQAYRDKKMAAFQESIKKYDKKKKKKEQEEDEYSDL